MILADIWLIYNEIFMVPGSILAFLLVSNTVWYHFNGVLGVPDDILGGSGCISIVRNSMFFMVLK